MIKISGVFFAGAFLTLQAISYGLAQSSAPSSLSQYTCEDATISACPSFYDERCRTDDDFKKSNALACLKVRDKQVTDQAFCSSPQIAQCATVTNINCDDETDPVARHFCKSGRLDCPRNIPVLVGRYDNVLGQYKSAMNGYQDILNIDPRKITEVESMCQYKASELDSFLSLSKADRTELQKFDGELDSLKSCTTTMEEFLEGGRPPELTEELWENIRTGLSEKLKGVTLRSGEIKSQQELLNEAPKKLTSLKVAHGLVCPADNTAN